MKKKIITASVIIICVLYVLIHIGIIAGVPHRSKSFSINDYLYEIRQPEFQSFETYGMISNSSQALAAAKAIFSERFSYDPGVNIINPVGWEIRRDGESDTWLVRSYRVLPFTEGGEYTVILSADGSVIAVWGGK